MRGANKGATTGRLGKTGSVVFCVSHILTLGALSRAGMSNEHGVPPSPATRRRRLTAIHFPRRHGITQAVFPAL